jgi:cation diffusion facilitator family transporter
LIALGFRWSRRPRDIEHPFGHGRVEAVATLLLAVILLGVGAEVARSGIRRLLDPAPIHAPGWLLAAVGLTVAVKTWLALFARALARFTGSKVLEADSWNHTFDIASSLLVVVALGAARMGRPSVDGYAALGVAVCIAYTGWRYGKDAVNELIGRAPSPQQLDSIRALALAVPGVRGVHDIIVHEYGDVRLVSLHIEVSADRSVMDAHELAERVEQKVAAEASAKAVVHVDPVDRKHPAYPQVDHALRHFAAEHAELVGYHDLRINGASDGYDFAVDLVVRTSVQPAQFGRFLEEARDRLHRELAAAGRIELGIETEYASDPEHRLQFMR